MLQTLIAYLMETSLHHLMQVAILSVYTGAQSPRVECRVRREAGGKCIPGLGRRVGMNGVDKFLFFSPRNTIKVDLRAEHVSGSISLSIFSYSLIVVRG